jgi:hypothetical protein
MTDLQSFPVTTADGQTVPIGSLVHTRFLLLVLLRHLA